MSEFYGLKWHLSKVVPKGERPLKDFKQGGRWSNSYLQKITLKERSLAHGIVFLEGKGPSCLYPIRILETRNALQTPGSNSLSRNTTSSRGKRQKNQGTTTTKIDSLTQTGPREEKKAFITILGAFPFSNSEPINPSRLTRLGQAESVDSFGEVINPHVLRSISILIKFLRDQSQYNDLLGEMKTLRWLIIFLFLNQSCVLAINHLSSWVP